MDKLQSMQVLLEAVDAGSFSAAARNLGLSSVMVGKHVRRLEEQLGIQLIERSTRSQRLTSAGIIYCEAARTVLAQIKMAESAIESLQANPSGLVRISAPLSLGAWIAPVISRYVIRHPALKIELVLSNRYVNLINDQFDLAIRVGKLVDSELIARPLPPYQMVICGTPAYLHKAGIPMVPADLKHHSCLGHLSVYGCIRWPLKGELEICWPGNGNFASNDGYVLRQAALEGAGLILQPELLVEDDIAAGRLVEVLHNYRPEALPANLLYQSARQPQHRLSNLVDYILAQTCMKSRQVK